MNSICCERGTLPHFFAVRVIPTLFITAIALAALYFLGRVLSQDENLAPLSIVKNICTGTFTVLLTALPMIGCLVLCTQIWSKCYSEYMKEQEAVLSDVDSIKNTAADCNQTSYGGKSLTTVISA